MIARFVHPPPLELVRDGKMLRLNMRRELVTPDELMSQLREQGLHDLALVKSACMEGDGHIRVVKRDGGQHPPPKKTTS